MAGERAERSGRTRRTARLRAVPDVAVVIPTFRRPALLGRCLSGLLAQDLPLHRFEIFVCDDGCDSDTYYVAKTFARRGAVAGLHVGYIAVGATRGPAGARNQGWRAAHAPIIAFTDDDTLPDPAWLRAGIRAMADGAAAAAGCVRVPLPEIPTDYEADVAGLERSEFATANCFVRRTVLVTVGGFDQRYTSAWREDSDLHFCILKAGGKIVRASEAVVVHPVRPAAWGTSIAQQKKSQFDALLCKRHPAHYATRIAAHPPWPYYGALSGLVLALVGLVVGSRALGVAGAIVWAAFTAAFMAKRLRGTSRKASHLAEMLVTSIAIPPLSVFWRLYGAVKFRTRFL